MPPNFTRSIPETVDLTADSDDDDAPITRPHGTGRVPPAVNRKSGQSYVRSPKPTTIGKGSSSRQSNGQLDPAEPSLRRNLDNLKSSAAPARKAGTSETLKTSQTQQTGRSDESSQPATKSSGLRKEVQRKARTDIVVIDDPEDELPAFKQPPGRDMGTLKQSHRNSLPRESLSGMPKGQAKRGRDSDSQESGEGPLKRQRLTQSFNDGHSVPFSNNVSQASPDSNRRSRYGLLKDDISKSGGAPGGKREGLTSSLPKTGDSHSLEKDADRASSPNRNENTSMRPRNGLFSSDVRNSESGYSQKQRDSISTKASPSRHQSSTPKRASGGEDDNDTHSSSASGGHSSRRDTTPRIRKETAKAQALSAERKSKSQSGADAQSPSGQSGPANPRPSDLPRPKQGGNGGQETPSNRRPAATTLTEEERDASTQRPGRVRQSEAARKPVGSMEPKPEAVSEGIMGKAKDTSRASNEDKFTKSSSRRPAIDTINGHRARTKSKVPFADDSESDLGSKETSPEPDSSPPRTRRREKASAATARDKSLDSVTGSNVSKATRPSGIDVTQTRSPKGEAGIQTANALAEEADLQLRTEALKSDDQNSIINDLRNSFAKPTIAASAMKTTSSYSRTLPLGNQVEKILGKYLEELGDDNEYWTSVSLSRARLSKQASENTDGASNLMHGSGQEEKPTSFAKLRPLGWSTNPKGGPSAKSDQLWGIERMSNTGRGAGPIWLSAEYTSFETDVPDVPSYAHYVSIKNNILAPNVTKLICWPYFGDDFDCTSHTNMHDQYHLDIDDRERKLVLLLKAQKYEEYVQSALDDLGCSWADVLRFLLEDEPDVGNLQDAMKAASNRDDLLDNDFSRISERWQSILADLPASNPEKLARAAVLCDNFQKLAKFSLWHVARRSKFAKLPGEGDDSGQKAVPSDNQLTCRICLRFNCPYHGELKEQENSDSDDDDDSDSVVDSVVATDIIHPPRVNYRTRVAIPPSYTAIEDTNEVAAAKNDKKDPRFWRKDDFNHLPDERSPFYPCHHPGTSCADAQCSCFENRIPCEKICSCAPDCPRKFQGCSCTTARFKKGSRGPCFEDERCACYQSGRECDPDLCGDCGACEVVDPVSKDDDSVLAGRCRNCSIQRGVPKQTLLGDSGVHGLGLYACEDIREHDFVGEYKGEIITKEEAERRGAVYEIQKLSYLFSLNATQEIDSTNFGNKVRFINHAKVKANLYPRIIMVNTVHRIALYASTFIKPGQELLFDYGPKFPDDQLGGKKSKKSAPHVRNAELVRNFYEVEESEDEAGNVRAKAVAHGSRSRNKTKPKKPRGGARPNAGRKPRVRKVHDEQASAGAFTEQDAGERLAAFNISDEVRSDLMDLDDELGGDEDDEYEDEDGFESEDSYGTNPSNNPDSDEDDEDAEDDEDPPSNMGRQNRGAGSSRRRFR